MTNVITHEDIGKLVATPSGVVLGRIIRVTASSFLFQADQGETTWLADDCVFTNDLRVVTLICERSRVPLYETQLLGSNRVDAWHPRGSVRGPADAAGPLGVPPGSRSRRRSRRAPLVPCAVI